MICSVKLTVRLRALIRGVILGILVCLLFPSFPADAKKKASPDESKASGSQEAKSSAQLYKDLDLFTKVLTLIREDYVENPNDRDMVYGAIRGMLATLDPHSVFMPPDVYRELKVDTEGKFGGVGMEVTVKDNFLTVVTAIEGSPAQKAGVREGDRILKIDGVATRELGLSEAVRKMRGARGTKVTLSLLHTGSRDPVEVTLARDIIHLKSIRWEMPEEGFGYVRITSFQEDTAEDLEKALEALNHKAKGGLKGLVLDLRNNPGGLLDEAVDVCDLFLESGTIVSTASRNHEVDKRVATRSGAEPTYPIVSLVNGGSASAAEIVAGALQDNKRAVILGTRTFGKGSVQTIFELGDGAALKLTVAKYYTPKGRSIQAEGIHPDVVVEAKSPENASTRNRTLREKDLKGHLESEKSHGKSTEKDKKPEMTVKQEPSSTETEEDYQKRIALDYLKGKNVFSKSKAIKDH